MALSESAFAQSEMPRFDSFSYTIQDALPGTRPESQSLPLLSEQEGFELQLALDKAISQILKLTVDYEALRTRVQAIDKSVDGGNTQVLPAQADAEKELKQLDEMKAIHTEQLTERDKQLAALIIRLDALQIKFDQENEARTLAENQLKAVQNKKQEIETTVSENAAKSNDLTEQFKINQAQLVQLEMELSVAKEAIDNLLAERKQAVVPVQTIVQEVTPGQFASSNEWVIEGLEFDQGSADIEQHSIQTLDAILGHLKQNPGLNIQVNGYTDSVGSNSSNLRLSQARADAVASYLVAQGIESRRVNTLGYGERRPLGDNTLEQGRLLNRRVAVLFLN